MNRTLVMDRRALPASAVIAIARPHHGPRTPLPPAPVAAEPSPDATHPSLRRTRETATYQRLAIGLAIGLAFAAGLATSFGAQLGSSRTTASREAREGTTRSASLRLVDGTEGNDQARGRAPALPSSAAPGPRSATPTRASATPAPSAAPLTTHEAAAPVEGDDRDILDRGLAGE
jgi:hypothetical protein